MCGKGAAAAALEVLFPALSAHDQTHVVSVSPPRTPTPPFTLARRLSALQQQVAPVCCGCQDAACRT